MKRLEKTPFLFTFVTLVLVSTCLQETMSHTVLDQDFMRVISSRNSTHLDLSLNSITHIDHWAFVGTNTIRSLNLSKNSLTYIGQSFNQYLTQIVYQNGSWPTGYHFDNLLVLDLSYNKIAYIDALSFLGAFCETLDLSFNELTSLNSLQLFTWVSFQASDKYKVLIIYF